MSVVGTCDQNGLVASAAGTDLGGFASYLIKNALWWTPPSKNTQGA